MNTEMKLETRWSGRSPAHQTQTKRSFRKLGLAVILGALALSASACRTTVIGPPIGGGGGYYPDPYYQVWYDVYGYSCGTGQPRAGCNFYSDGSKILDYEDPYYYSHGQYLEYGTWEYTDSWGYYSWMTGYGWLSPTGILYDEYGYALNEQDSSGRGRDWSGAVAEAEAASVKGASRSLVERFSGLHETQALRIAESLNEWATLGKSRTRTTADVAAFSERMFNVKVGDAVKAITQANKGDIEGLASLNDNIAQHWGTSPQTSKAILTTWYKAQWNELESGK